LYPDSLVAQVLTAAENPSGLAQSLAQSPVVLDEMQRNPAWTAALGDAYANQPDNVMDAVQYLRQQAQAAGTLSSNGEETVTTQGQTIVIEQSDPAVAYVPTYDPWLAYGTPLVAYPGWVGLPGYYAPGYFGAGLGLGLLGGAAWGLHHDNHPDRFHDTSHHFAPDVHHDGGFHPGGGFRPGGFPHGGGHIGAGHGGGFHGTGFHGGGGGFHGGGGGFHGGGGSHGGGGHH
jgi:hypothetical protein